MSTQFVRVTFLVSAGWLRPRRRTNCVDIGWAYDPRTNRVILMSAEDNVVKGAGGQAVQSFNIMCGFDETEGLWVL